MNENETSGSSAARGKRRFNYNRGRFNFRRSKVPKNNENTSERQQLITVNVSTYVGPYKGWKLYYPQDDYVENSDTHKKIKASEKYVLKNKSSFDVVLQKYNYVQVDLTHLSHDEEFNADWPTFNVDLTNDPRSTLSCMGLAIHQIFNAEEKVIVRPVNHQPVIALTSLKVNFFGKLVTIRGTVIRVGSPGLMCKTMAFECTSCRATQALIQPQGIYTVPTLCISCKRYGKFNPLHSSPFTVTIDYQVAKIQETQVHGGSGSIPRSIEVELHGDLVGSASPGDLLSITGIVQVHEDNRSDDGKKSARLMQIYIEAIAVHNQRTLNYPTLTFTLKDYYAIQEIYSTDNVFRLLVQSLCPSIYGQEIVKAGLILGLLGGTEVDGGSRSNPHVLIVGDPGLGKSQMLQAATLVAPRGVYVCGNACTATGLTVSLSRSEGGGFTLEAGALVLADRGVCCVDELDKLNSIGHGALLEAMEQGSVSVARGGVVCRLAAAPTVLAAANPCQGHYDRSKTVCENLKMSAPLLSRFDLVFILFDNPNEYIDSLLSNHVLAMHSGESMRNINAETMIDSSSSEQKKLTDRLKLSPNEEFHPLPAVLLRKYIAYSRKYVHPKLSTKAAEVLKDFYLKLRESYKSNIGGAPITTRQLEACVRLTQARARACLREEATEEDAMDVIEIMKHSLIDTLCDESGALEMSRSVHGSGMSSKSHVKRFIAIIIKQANQLKKDIFTRNELIQIHKKHNLAGDAHTLVEALHVHGYLLLKSPNTYKILAL